jgi:hypothetical protein
MTAGYPQVIVTKKSLDAMLKEAVAKQVAIKSIITFKNRENIAKAVFTIGGTAFIRATNARARGNRQSFHHIYEWNQVGTQKGRLFNLVRTRVQGGRLVITSQFYESNTPVPISKSLASVGRSGRSASSKHIFRNKANVMEDGKPVRIRAKYANALVFASGRGLAFVPKPHSVLVRNPGGKFVKGSYTRHFREWFANPMNIHNAVAATGMFPAIEREVAKQLRIKGNGAPAVSSAIASVTTRYSKGATIL